MPVAENFRRRGKFEEIAFVFPNAPAIPITVVNLPANTSIRYSTDPLQNFGMRMPGWYDIVRPRDTVRFLTAPNHSTSFISEVFLERKDTNGYSSLRPPSAN